VKRLLLGLAVFASCNSHHPPSDEWKDCVPGWSFAACNALGQRSINLGSLRRVSDGTAGVLPKINSPTDTEWYVYYSIDAQPIRFQDVVDMLDQALGPHGLGRIPEISYDAPKYWKSKNGFWTADSVTSTIQYLAVIHSAGSLKDDEIDRAAAQQHDEVALWTKLCEYLASH